MFMRMKSFAPLGLALAVGAVSLPQMAWSQTAAPQVQGQPAPGQPAQRQMRPSRIEGRIAFLRAELKITNAQAAAFDNVANAMRENDRTVRAAFEARQQQQGQPSNLLDRLDRRQKGAEAMASATSRLKAAWAPLYASLSDEQKKIADELYEPRGGHRMGPHRT
jgi:hypothetical protein